jgi:type I thyroxine 5'-deiodinase
MDSNVKEGIVFTNPQGYEERVNLAGTCAVKLGIKFPALVDDISNATELAYTGWPDRPYVVDREGRIAYKSDAGPYGFNPGGVRETLQRLLPR